MLNWAAFEKTCKGLDSSVCNDQPDLATSLTSKVSILLYIPILLYKSSASNCYHSIVVPEARQRGRGGGNPKTSVPTADSAVHGIEELPEHSRIPYFGFPSGSYC